MKRMWSLKQIKEFIKGTTKDISTLVDADGHERFIEGDIAIEEITGVTKKYGKWSLSGSHLLIVLACDIANGTELADQLMLAAINIPKWIFNKIVPLVSTIIETGSNSAWASNFTTQAIGLSLLKNEANKNMLVRLASAFTATADRTIRVKYDLLIDND